MTSTTTAYRATARTSSIKALVCPSFNSALSQTVNISTNSAALNATQDSELMQMAHVLNSPTLDAWSLVPTETAYNVKVLIIY